MIGISCNCVYPRNYGVCPYMTNTHSLHPRLKLADTLGDLYAKRFKFYRKIKIANNRQIRVGVHTDRLSQNRLLISSQILDMSDSRHLDRNLLISKSPTEVTGTLAIGI